MSNYRILKRSIDLGDHKEKIIYIIEKSMFQPSHNCMLWVILSDKGPVKGSVQQYGIFNNLPDAIKFKEKLDLIDGIVVG